MYPQTQSLTQSAMKLSFLLLLAGVPLVSALSATGAPVMIDSTEQRLLPQKIQGRQLKLLIQFPPSFHKNPNRKYPLIFLPDAYFSFPSFCTFVGTARYDRQLPEVLLAGLSYVAEEPEYQALRLDDFLPGYAVGATPRETEAQAKRFVAWLETDLLPLLDTEYRADPAHRIFVGGSAAATLALFLYYTRPELFEAYVAASPALYYQIWQYEAAFAETGRKAGPALYLSQGLHEDPESQGEFTRFVQRLHTRTYFEQPLQFELIPGERHGGACREGMMKGILTVAQNLAPYASGPIPTYYEGAEGEIYSLVFRPAKRELSRTADERDSLLRAHEEKLRADLKDKKVLEVFFSPTNATEHYTNVFIAVSSRRAAEDYVKADPAVANGVLDCEVIGNLRVKVP